MGEGLLGLDKSYDIKLNTIKFLFTAGIIPQPEFSLYLEPDYNFFKFFINSYLKYFYYIICCDFSSHWRLNTFMIITKIKINYINLNFIYFGNKIIKLK